jgi:hypothetical protein
MLVDCGVLGEQELTISYRYHKGVKQTQFEPGCGEFATIGWIKFGGVNGTEVDLTDDFIDSEVIPYCVDDWNGEIEYAQERKAEDMREAA